MDFRLLMDGALNEMLVGMLEKQADSDSIDFQTINDRPCLLALAVGEDAVEKMKKQLQGSN